MTLEACRWCGAIVDRSVMETDPDTGIRACLGCVTEWDAWSGRTLDVAQTPRLYAPMHHPSTYLRNEPK